MIYFTSDLHFGHTNIIMHSKRPFLGVTEMNDGLIERYNSVVTNKDDVYILGDVAFCDPTPLVARMNGRKHLIMGNHDHPKKSKLHGCAFQWIKDTYELSVNGQKIWLAHYPHRAWPNSHHGAWHLYGHSHGNMPPHGRSMDVGVDVWGYYPVSFENIQTEMARLGAADINHHEKATHDR